LTSEPRRTSFTICGVQAPVRAFHGPCGGTQVQRALHLGIPLATGRRRPSPVARRASRHPPPSQEPSLAAPKRSHTPSRVSRSSLSSGPAAPRAWQRCPHSRTSASRHACSTRLSPSCARTHHSRWCTRRPAPSLRRRTRRTRICSLPTGTASWTRRSHACVPSSHATRRRARRRAPDRTGQLDEALARLCAFVTRYPPYGVRAQQRGRSCCPHRADDDRTRARCANCSPRLASCSCAADEGAGRAGSACVAAGGVRGHRGKALRVYQGYFVK
jgi:hypothetical protein